MLPSVVRREAALVALVGLASIGAIRCGGRTDLVALIPEADFVVRLAVARCAQIDDCCRADLFSFGRSDCSTDVIADTQKSIDEAVRSGAKYDAVAGAACVASFSAVCVALESFKTRRDYGGPCNRVYTGGRTALGGACTTEWSCQGNETGRVGCGASEIAGAVVRTCQTVVLAAPSLPQIGDPCMGSIGDPCAPGSVCDRSNTQRCVIALGTGEGCTSDERCELYRCTNGRCQSPGSVAGDAVCVP
jgi:hypothetical protein